MKAKNILALTCTIALFTSCSIDKSLTKSNDQKSEITASTSQIFVQTKNGKTIYFKSLKLIKGPFTSPHLLADNNIKFQCNDIVAYQNKDHYAVSQNIFANGKKSFVSTDALPGFAVRTVKGKLNVYCKKYFNGNNSVDEFYIQSGSNGKIFVYTPQLMMEMITENEFATAYFNEEKEMKIAEKIKSTAEIFNSASSMSKN
jgi:hypothetical protein